MEIANQYLAPGKEEETRVVDTQGHTRIAILIDGPIIQQNIKYLDMEAGEMMKYQLRKQINCGRLLDYPH